MSAFDPATSLVRQLPDASETERRALWAQWGDHPPAEVFRRHYARLQQRARELAALHGGDPKVSTHAACRRDFKRPRRRKATTP